MSYVSKKLIIYKPEGYSLEESVIKKAKAAYTSEYCFYIYLNKEKNIWYCSYTKPVKISDVKDLLEKENKSILIFVDYASEATFNPISFKKGDVGQWWMSSIIGSLNFISSITEMAPKLFFENFSSFLDFKNLVKLLTKVSLNCPSTHCVAVNGVGVKLIGDKWVEKEGIYYSSLDFLDKISYAQKSFLKNVLAFLSGKNVKEEIERLDKLSDGGILEESVRHKGLKEKLELL